LDALETTEKIPSVPDAMVIDLNSAQVALRVTLIGHTGSVGTGHTAQMFSVPQVVHFAKCVEHGCTPASRI
jgi:hypothetical protein